MRRPWPSRGCRAIEKKKSYEEFKGAISSSDDVVSSGRLISEKLIVKDVEGGGCGYTSGTTLQSAFKY
jgi:hypothetical protein